MSENDDVIGAILFATEMLMRQSEWNIKEAGTSDIDTEAAEFVRTCMNDMDETWSDFISEVLSFLTYGWSYHEIVYKRRMGNTKNPETRSKYSDSLIGWRKLPAALAGKQRSKRNLRLLEQELSEHPDDYEVMGYLGDEYSSYGEKEQALCWYRKSVEHMPEALREGDPRSAWTFSALIALYGEKGEISEAEGIYRLAVGKQPEEADYDYQMGCLCVAGQRWEDGIRYLAGGLAKLEQHGSANSCMRIKAALEEVYGNLALCFLRSGRRGEAVETSVALLKAKPFEMKALYILLSAFYEDGGGKADTEAYVESVSAFLGKLYPLPDLKSRLFIARAAEKAGWEAMRIRMEAPPK